LPGQPSDQPVEMALHVDGHFFHFFHMVWRLWLWIELIAWLFAMLFS
jgi:hypothetical protein